MCPPRAVQIGWGGKHSVQGHRGLRDPQSAAPNPLALQASSVLERIASKARRVSAAIRAHSFPEPRLGSGVAALTPEPRARDRLTQSVDENRIGTSTNRNLEARHAACRA